MKLNLLVRWLLLILCSQAFLSLAHEINNPTLTDAGSDLLEQLGGEKQPLGSNVTIGLNEDHEKSRYEEVKIFSLSGLRGSSRGTGGYGGSGGNINLRPAKTYWKSDASTLLAKPSSIISVNLVQVSIILLLVFFHILV
ncbi:uncharacterized protein LOC122086420 [Macadamia integrifolia]|uniref:uncharacterized protein LOC122086420 n=1 Tax=Macadamia integrifolia TaxID=60698 RepID=UPI001C4EE801|nr:uncharacterized protein LOC122086420 [Macadamia integrifolia]